MKNLTIDNFDSTIEGSKDTFIVCFSTHWCPPCQIMKQTLAELDAKNIAGVSVCFVDADQEQELSARFGVFSIPTTVFIKDGVETARMVGAKSIETLEAKIASMS